MKCAPQPIIAALLLASAINPFLASAQADQPPSLVSKEPAKPGSLDWRLTRVRLDNSDGYRSPHIEGYCSKQSVIAGESIDIMVSTALRGGIHPQNW